MCNIIVAEREDIMEKVLTLTQEQFDKLAIRIMWWKNPKVHLFPIIG